MADATFAQCKRDGSPCLEKPECRGDGCAKPGDTDRQRLIAAAPDLLEALQDVLDEWVRDLTDAGEEDVEERAYVKFARAALARATGSAS